eukprot:876627-Ditylum_brightwellii.AAC.1
MTKKAESEKNVSWAYSVAQYSNDKDTGYEYMMNAKVKEGKETDSDLPDLIKNNHDTDLDDESNNKAKVETKQSTCKKTNGHPETIIALLVTPGLKKNKMGVPGGMREQMPCWKTPRASGQQEMACLLQKKKWQSTMFVYLCSQ